MITKPNLVFFNYNLQHTSLGVVEAKCFESNRMPNHFSIPVPERNR